MIGVPHKCVVKFNLKSMKDERRRTAIRAVMRFDLNGKKLKLVYPVKLSIAPNQWSVKQHRPKQVFKDYNEYKDELGKIEDAIKKVFKRTGPVPLVDLRNQIDIELGRAKKPKQDTLFGFIDEYIRHQKYKPNANRDSWKKLETTFNHLKNFADEKREGQLSFNDIDWRFRNDFLEWLYSPPREHSINHASKLIQITRQFMYEAKRLGLHANTEFEQRGFNVRKTKTKFPVLDFDELKVLANLDLSANDKLDRVRDLFLIGAYSGLRVSDFTRLKPHHIIEDQGVEMINLITFKTGTEVCIPLMPELKKILRKHSFCSPPAISNQRMNEYLKELCEIAGLDRPVVMKSSKGGNEIEDHVPLHSVVSTHTARRSFATNFYSMGIPVYILKSIVGHATEKQFFDYINVDKKKAARTMASMVAEIVRNSSDDK